MPCMRLVDVVFAERRDSKCDVVEHFGLDPAETKRNERTERWVFGYADERLDALQHRLHLNGESPAALGTSGKREAASETQPDLFFVAQVEGGPRQHRSCAEPWATAT